MNNNLFILKTISIRPKTEEIRHKYWQIHQIKYERKMPYEAYINFLKNWHEYDFLYSEENNCYFTDYNTAKEFAENNASDINDGGVYNYIAIIEVPFECTYANTEVKNIYAFKYNRKSDKYTEVSEDYNEETKYIFKELECTIKQ
ncbi:hypothetical protein ACFHWD_04310 [Clostridium sp. MT-14]|uniref:hypothetical protein n=1 Tax=Clostridium sp. MT-14 TaxID=3348360 RepID=UPI0035F2D6B7